VRLDAPGAGALHEALAAPPHAFLDPGDLAAEVRAALAGSPFARALDLLLEAARAAGGAGGMEDAGAALARLRALLADVEAGRTAPEAALRDARPLLDALSARARAAVHEALVDEEREALARLPSLQWLRSVLARAEEAGDRAAALRLVNQVALARQEEVRFAEVPLLVDGALRTLPVRVRRRRGGRPSGGGDGESSVQIDVTLSAVGPVRARVGLEGTRAVVGFQVRDAAVQRLFREHLPELVEGLAKAGLQAQAEVGVAAKPPRAESPLEEFVRPAGEGVDCKA
jgi:hypothetical protein